MSKLFKLILSSSDKITDKITFLFYATDVFTTLLSKAFMDVRCVGQTITKRLKANVSKNQVTKLRNIF